MSSKYQMGERRDNIANKGRRGLKQMKCPKEIRLCPNGWENCSLCKYVGLDNTCLYPKSDIEIVILAAKIAEEVVDAGAREDAEKIRGTWIEELNRVAETDEFWTWFYKDKRPGDLHAVEPYKAMSGPTEPGGSNVKCKKETKGTKPTIYKWGEFN